MADTEKVPATGYRELGVSGLDRYTGRVPDEPEFLGREWIETIIKMKQSDPVIGAVLKIIKLIISAIPVSVEPSDEHDADSVRIARYTTTMLHDMDRPFIEVIGDIASMIDFGWSVMEPVYKKRRGPKPRPYAGAPSPEPSKHDDGLIGWAGWYPRGQATLWKWIIDGRGHTTHFQQFSPYGGGIITLPLDRVMLFRTEAYLDNPEGTSALRNAWRPWYFKSHVEQIEAIGIERDLSGVPIVWVPPEYLKEDASEDHKSLVDEMLDAASGMRLDESAALAIPLAYVPNSGGQKQFDFTLMSTNSRRQYDTSGIIQRWDHRIALAFLAQFMMLGSSDIGSFALASSHQDMFNRAVNSYLTRIAQVANKREMPRIAMLNGDDPAKAAVMAFGQIESIDMDKLTSGIQRLTQSGMRFFPSRETEDHILRRFGMPIPDDDDRPKSGPPLGARPAQGGGRPPSGDTAPGENTDDEQDQQEGDTPPATEET